MCILAKNKLKHPFLQILAILKQTFFTFDFMQRYSGTITDLINKKIFKGHFEVLNGIITSITPDERAEGPVYLPGFIDAHVHIESSMLTPAAFGAAAVVHGTVATVSDPHEIANVLGVNGIMFMLDNAQKTAFKCFFGAPSCVPATSFESAGAIIDANDIELLLQRNDLFYLCEMMNYPGVLQKDTQVMAKLDAAKKLNKPIDGHAPGLIGSDAIQYFENGISTDHECFTLAEALEKASLGVKILIREGSAAKNFDALHPLLNHYPHLCMFCSDDKHPDDLMLGHINLLVKRALLLGYDLMHVLRAACLNPVIHYGLPVGLLQIGHKADFIAVDNFENLQVLKTVINGEHVFENGRSKLLPSQTNHPNNFNISKVFIDDLKICTTITDANVRVIQALDKQLITKTTYAKLPVENGEVQPNQNEDILKLIVCNRYKNAPLAKAFIKGFGLKDAAIASTVAHDSHNLIAVGTSDELLVKAMNLVVDAKGGIAFANNQFSICLPLPIAGLMTDQPAEVVTEAYQHLDFHAKKAGSQLTAPYMTLSFMALLVIPQLKLSDLGLFDGSTFNFVSIYASK